jgi:hypothetical protein
MRTPLVVDFISNNEEALGAVVPIPAAPVDGNVFVCAVVANDSTTKKNTVQKIIFIKDFFE